ncbi:hypothetical protein, partial [Klebsiella pneumoniae]|uniref:hypothetical protein n=1 Tax=Klebsiella pneumoniae TaxID=573 RepID=UPI002731DF04
MFGSEGAQEQGVVEDGLDEALFGDEGPFLRPDRRSLKPSVSSERLGDRTCEPLSERGQVTNSLGGVILEPF